MSRNLKIAICGTRGIPARYGGFETFAEELSARLVEAGHTVRVYARSRYIPKDLRHYRGAQIIRLPAVYHKYLETISHSAFSFIHLLFDPVDVVLICNAANSPLAWILKIRRIPCVVNVDGVERKRAKWNVFGRLWYRLGEICSCLFANRIIADAYVIQDYYAKKYRSQSSVIRYGFRDRNPSIDSHVLAEYQLSAGHYLLYVSRLEPENNALVVVRAYNELALSIRKKMPLVVVGDAPYSKEYIEQVKAEACSQVVFLGYKFEADYFALQTGAYAYIQATEVGGAHPALIEAMGFGKCIIANDVPEHREVLGNAGLYYAKKSVTDLAIALDRVISNHDLHETLEKQAFKRAKAEFDWAKITTAYAEVFLDLCK